MRHVLLALLVVAGLLLGGCASGQPSVTPTDGGAPTGAGALASEASGPDASRSDASGSEAPVAAPTVPPLHPSVDDYPEAVVTLAGPDGRTERVAVKVADTAGRRQHGLMEVGHLPDGTGMLFVFDEDHRGGFWMKDTLVPLSIAFIGADGDVLAILDMEPCEDDPCPTYDPEVTYRYALEVPQGWFADVGIDEGWHVEDLPVR